MSIEALMQFVSPEAGQARRRALEEWLSEQARYYLGPTGIPQRLGLANEILNPVAALEAASQDAQRTVEPGLSGLERAGYGAQALANTIAAGLPGAMIARTAARAPAAGAVSRAPAEVRRTVAYPESARTLDERVAHTEAAMRGRGILDRNRAPRSNMLFDPDRAYRAIGPEGYRDFLDTGLIRARRFDTGATDYDVPYFMRGQVSGRYAQGDGGRYIVEAAPNPATWRTAAGEWGADPYIAPRAGQLTRRDALRIFEQLDNGDYRIVEDYLSGLGLRP
jgi:hypothetical protein